MVNADKATGKDAASVAVNMTAGDSIRWRPRIRVDKYDDDQVAYVARKTGILAPDGNTLNRFVKPFEVVERDGNILVTAGLQRLTNLLIAAGGQGLTATAARLGVGNSATAAAVGQTDLQAVAGAANRWFMPMDTTYPTAVGGVVTMKSTWATADGNFVWAEWCSDIGTPVVAASAVVSATMLNRAAQSLGTKVSGAWALTATITIS